MGKTKKTRVATNGRTREESQLPEGFEPLTSGRVAGWFLLEEGNEIRGILRDTFVVDGKFGKKNVHKILITSGTTRIMHPENGETDVGEGEMVGIDETGWLKALSDVGKGREIYIKCTGKDAPTKDFPRGVWKFLLGVVPLPKDTRDNDDLPF